ncbi:MAG: hypothetical protein RIC53_16350 [Cyclobacteriaceae bacterium]
MQRKLNDEFIREYSEEFSEKITADFFADKDLISGKEILNVTPSKQVNFFVLKILFRKWQEEMKRLESPFFNYKNPEVRKAMVQFMNTLSQHIEVKKELFGSMMEEAVADTLLLAVDPGSYISLEFEEMDVTHVTEKMTKPIFKYLKLHKSEIEEFFAENNGMELDEFVENAEEFFVEVNVDAAVKQQVDLLSQIVPLSVDDVYFKEEDLIDLDDEIPNASDEIDEDDQEVSFDHDEEGSYDEETFEDNDEDDREVEEENEDSEKKDEVGDLDDSGFDDELNEDYQAEEIDEPENDDEPELDEVADTSEDSEEEFDIEESDEEPEDDQEDLSDEEDEDEDQDEQDNTDDEDDAEAEPVNEHFTPIQKTVNEQFSESESPTLADKLEQKKVGSIMEAISVNHRYMFTKELFDGDREAFVKAIEKIEQCNSFDDAVEVLVQNYASKLGWDMNSDEVKELLKVIFRKYR